MFARILLLALPFATTLQLVTCCCAAENDALFLIVHSAISSNSEILRVVEKEDGYEWTLGIPEIKDKTERNETAVTKGFVKGEFTSLVAIFDSCIERQSTRNVYEPIRLPTSATLFLQTKQSFQVSFPLEKEEASQILESELFHALRADLGTRGAFTKVSSMYRFLYPDGVRAEVVINSGEIPRESKSGALFESESAEP